MTQAQKEECKTIIRSIEFTKAQLLTLLERQEEEARRRKGEEKEDAEAVCDQLTDALDCLESAVDSIYDAIE